MKIVKFKTMKHEFQFVCTHRNTRYGFAHDATLLINGAKAKEATCYYLNRTWEWWGYQSVCLKCISLLRKDREDYLKWKFKEDNNLSRITAKHKPELEKIIKNDERMKVLASAKKVLSERLF